MQNLHLFQKEGVNNPTFLCGKKIINFQTLIASDEEI